MAKVGFSCKMKGKILSVIFISLVLLVSFSFADDFNDAFSGEMSTPAPDWNSPAYLEQNFQDNPLEAFNKNPTGAWDYLSKNPTKLSDPKVLDAAFSSVHLPGTMIEMNNHPDFLTQAKVLDRFDLEVQG